MSKPQHQYASLRTKNVQKNTKYAVKILNFLKQPLTSDLQVKGHFLCVVSICDMNGVEALLLRPHPHQGENRDIPERCNMDKRCET